MQWLLFIPQLPAKPDYLRVKLRRRLDKLGAVLLKSSVYALPHQGDCLEDFAWLRQDLLKDGGDAIISSAALIAGMTDAAVSDAFRRDLDRRYASVASEAHAARDADAPQVLSRLRRRMTDLIDIDYFIAPGRTEADAALRLLEARLQGEGRMTEAVAVKNIGGGRTWVTRAGAKVDRIGSAWLIRRFIDHDARFVFVDPQAYTYTEGELRFDMFEGEFTHEGDHCTFETLIEHFSLRDPALSAVAEVVHDIDMKEMHYGRPETAGIASLIAGLAAGNPPDEERLIIGFGIFDSLYSAFKAAQRI